MRCRQAKKLLSPYIDDELRDEVRSSLEKHLESCEACRAELEALKKISRGLKELYRQVKAPPGFVDSVMKCIEELEEGKSPRRLPVVSPSYITRWRLVALVAVIVVGVGLGVLQYGRANTGSLTVWRDSGSPPVPGTVVVAESGDGVPAAGEKMSDGEQEQAAATPGNSGAGKKVPDGYRPGAGEKQVKTRPGTPAPNSERSAGDSPPGNTAAEQHPRVQGNTDTRVAAGQENGSQQKVFLSRSRHIRTTMVKVEVDNLPYAKEVVAVLAEKAGAVRPREVWVYQQEEAILRAVLPTGSTDQFLEKIARLGHEFKFERETVDITAEFDRNLLEYQRLAGKQDSESQALAKALERQLQDLDRETLEAGKEVVNVWLKLR
ncbi:zf-HC2 domain-containing protein [Neomoorella glycerini]|nr:zf-HC2 domain-containing protein [Moorella glycerini]